MLTLNDTSAPLVSISFVKQYLEERGADYDDFVSAFGDSAVKKFGTVMYPKKSLSQYLRGDGGTFEESLKLLDDVVIESNGKMMIMRKGTKITETVGTGAIALVPASLETDEENEEEVEEASNSQVSELNLDY